MTYAPGRFKEYLSLAGWTEDCSDCPGVWDSKPKGHKAIWTCTWSTSRGVITPNDILPVELLTDSQLQHEVSDWIYSKNMNISAAMGHVLLASQNSSRESWRNEARKAIGNARKSAPQYLAAFDLPDREKIFLFRWRPGWQPVKPEPHPEPEVVEDTRHYPDRSGRPEKVLHPNYFSTGSENPAKKLMRAEAYNKYKEAERVWEQERQAKKKTKRSKQK